MIIIDMDMPASCKNCFANRYISIDSDHSFDSYRECALTKSEIPYGFGNKLDDCKLLEEKVGYHNY